MKKDTQKFFEGVGRRKTATARVRIFPGNTGFVVNGKDVNEYFKTEEQRLAAGKPLAKVTLPEKVSVSVKISGSGLSAQAEAVSLGLARAIAKLDSTLVKGLKSNSLLTRDSRMVERKKPGLKKARRAPQWAKR